MKNRGKIQNVIEVEVQKVAYTATWYVTSDTTLDAILVATRDVNRSAIPVATLTVTRAALNGDLYDKE